MTIFRYLNRQILQVMSAVTLILLVVALTSRFIQYLGDAVAGKLASDVLLLLMFYRLPDFLLVILPLALFLGILLAYGRMYAENEMVVLLGSGVSQAKLLQLSLGTAAFVTILVALLSMAIAPWGIRNTEQLKQDQEQLTEIDLIVAGQFQSFGEGGRVTYAERTSNAGADGKQLENVFVAIRTQEAEAADDGTESTEVFNPDASQDQGSLRLIIAASARPEIDPETGARFMRMENVVQYDGNPGQADYSVGQFDVQGILLPEATSFEEIIEEKAFGTFDLVGSAEPEHQAELQWRISTLIMIPIITLIAVPLSRVNPRQGRYSKLVPAALLYASYFVLLQFCRDLIADAVISPLIGMWWVHILYGSLGYLFYRGFSPLNWFISSLHLAKNKVLSK